MNGLPCPHGDDLCPCQDGDTCHYVGDSIGGTKPSPCPTTGIVGCVRCLSGPGATFVVKGSTQDVLADSRVVANRVTHALVPIVELRELRTVTHPSLPGWSGGVETIGDRRG